jgi:hypothetical protein
MSEKDKYLDQIESSGCLLSDKIVWLSGKGSADDGIVESRFSVSTETDEIIGEPQNPPKAPLDKLALRAFAVDLFLDETGKISNEEWLSRKTMGNIFLAVRQKIRDLLAQPIHSEVSGVYYDDKENGLYILTRGVVEDFLVLKKSNIDFEDKKPSEQFFYSEEEQGLIKATKAFKSNPQYIQAKSGFEKALNEKKAKKQSLREKINQLRASISSKLPEQHEMKDLLVRAKSEYFLYLIIKIDLEIIAMRKRFVEIKMNFLNHDPRFNLNYYLELLERNKETESYNLAIKKYDTVLVMEKMCQFVLNHCKKESRKPVENCLRKLQTTVVELESVATAAFEVADGFMTDLINLKSKLPPAPSQEIYVTPENSWAGGFTGFQLPPKTSATLATPNFPKFSPASSPIPSPPDPTEFSRFPWEKRPIGYPYFAALSQAVESAKNPPKVEPAVPREPFPGFGPYLNPSTTASPKAPISFSPPATATQKPSQVAPQPIAPPKNPQIFSYTFDKDYTLESEKPQATSQKQIQKQKPPMQDFGLVVQNGTTVVNHGFSRMDRHFPLASNQASTPSEEDPKSSIAEFFSNLFKKIFGKDQ